MPLSDRSRLPVPTRRSVVKILAVGLVVETAGIGGACAKRGDDAAGGDGARLQAMIDAGDVTIPADRYVLDRPITVPGGRHVAIASGAVFQYGGAAGGGVFVVRGDDVVIEAVGGNATVVASRPRLDLWAVAASAPRNLTVANIAARDCGHVHVGNDHAYGAVVTDGSRANVGRNIRIVGGGARYARPPGVGNGACWIEYAVDWEVTGADYAQVPHGVEWWGGNAAFDADGAAGAERKCRRFRISNVTVRDAAQGGIWGAMGEAGVIEDCDVERCGDVGLDAEGCADVRFTGCTARDGHNGALAAFFRSDAVVFERCTATSSQAAWPVFRNYNVSQDPVAGGTVTLRDCRFSCTDPDAAGTVDTGSGPLALLTVQSCTFTNVRIDTAFNNMHRVRIVNNVMTFTKGIDKAAIRVGASRRANDEQGGALVQGNVITFADGVRGSDGAGIVAVEDDYNSTADGSIVGNRVEGPVARGIVVRNSSGNAGIAPKFTVTGNTVADATTPVLVQHANGSAAPHLTWGPNAGRGGRTLAMPAPSRD